MQTLAKADVADIDELQESISIADTPRERMAKQFVYEAFKGKMPSLIPFALKNRSVLNIASYLLKYTKSQSKATLYQYVFGVHRFCQWINKSPDEIINEVNHNEKAINDYMKSIDAFVGDLQAEDLAPGTPSKP